MSANGIIFNFIPGSGLTVPGVFFEVNSGGQYQSITRVILQGYKTSAGTMAVNTPTPVSNQNDCDTFAGPGSMLREMFRIASANAPAQPIWIEAVTDPGTAPAQWTLTVASAPAAGQGTFEICGRVIKVPIASGGTTAQAATAMAAAINAYYNTLTQEMLPVTATASTNVVTLLARHPGIGLAASMYVNIFIDAGDVNNVFGPAGVITVANTVPGTGTPPDIAGALSALGDDPADFIVSPFADSTSTAAAIAALNDISGRWAWSRQSYGVYWTSLEGTFSTLTTYGLTQNDRHVSVAGAYASSPSPIWEWVAGEAGAEAPWLSDVTTGNVSRNQTGNQVVGLRGPRNRSLLWGLSSRNTLLNSGISTMLVDPYGQVQIDKTVTTYRVGTSGQPDTVFRDMQAMYQASGGLKYIRAVVAQEQGQKAFAAENPGNLGAITTPSDIKGTFIHAYTDMVFRGVFQDIDGFTRNLLVKANADNPNRCDILAPIERVNPLDILSVNATFYQQFPSNF